MFLKIFKIVNGICQENEIEVIFDSNLVGFLFYLVALKQKTNGNKAFGRTIKEFSNNDLCLLINGANYFDIELIFEHLLYVLASRFFNNSVSFFLKELDTFSMAYELLRKLLFFYLKYHFFNESQTTGGTSLSKPSFILSEFEFDCIYKNGLDLSDFYFLLSLNSDYLNSCYLSNEIFIDYGLLDLNLFCQNSLKNLIETLISEKDFKNTYVSGGFFSNYSDHSFLARKFSNMYRCVKSKKDIDIYLLDNKNSLSNYYKKKFLEKKINVFACCSSSFIRSPLINTSVINNDCSSFKIFFKGDILNFIFPQIWSNIQTYLKTFDFSITRIYYSYELNSIFVPIELINKYAYLKRPRNDLFETLSSVGFNFITCLVRKYLDMDYDDFIYILKTEMFQDFKILARFLKIGFKRILKYSLKNYYLNDIEASIGFKKIEFFLSIFSELFRSVYDITYMNVIAAFIKYHTNKLEEDLIRL